MSGNLVLFPSGRPEYVTDTWPVMEWLKNRQPSAARLKAIHKFSYADGFAANLAIQQCSSLITDDPEFRVLEVAGTLKLEWLGA